MAVFHSCRHCQQPVLHIFEPQALLYAGGYPEMTNTGVYSIGFFLFWLLTSLSSGMTSYFVKPCDEVNK